MDTFKKYTGHLLTVDEAVFKSEIATSATNQVLTKTMDSKKLLYGDPDDALMRYLKACSINVTCKDIALIAATWANEGVQPLSNERVLKVQHIRDILSAIAINGVYDTSGEWLYRIGIPTKSGIGGGLCCVVPGVCGIGIFSPLLDTHGNSVRGQKALEYLSSRFHFHIFDPRPPEKDWIPEAEYMELKTSDKR
jgi:glutaminase